MPRLEHGPAGSYIIYGRGYPPDGELIQSDWDFPGLAQSLGWSLLRVQRDQDGNVVHLKRVRRGHSEAIVGRKGVLSVHDWSPKVAIKFKANCQHSGTDGTVTCSECGLTATDFISAAAEWLDERAR